MKIGEYVKIASGFSNQEWYHDKPMKILGKTTKPREFAKHQILKLYIVDYNFSKEFEINNRISKIAVFQDEECVSIRKKEIRIEKLNRLTNEKI